MASAYEQQAYREMKTWQRMVQRKPRLSHRLTAYLQSKWNGILPEKLHQGLTIIIEKMVKGVLFGAKQLSARPKPDHDLEAIERKADKLISNYKQIASTEGAIAGSGGFLFGLAEFPVLIGIKIKLLFDLATAYGLDVKSYKERLYILYIFQLTFSSRRGRNAVYKIIADWEQYSHSLPEDADAFNWRPFQQEYRDYIDLAKMAQLIPFIGAAVGFVVNKKLITQLGLYAKNCFRMRHFQS
jgi:hypothetical protein